jgi:hypothetical protein
MIIEEGEDEEEEEGGSKKNREELKVPSSHEPIEKELYNQAVCMGGLNKSECTPAFKKHNVTSLHRSLRKQDKRFSDDSRPELH